MKANDANVFILGTMFCGSTLLGTALHQHPEVTCAGELAFLDRFYLALHGKEPSHRSVCFSCGFAGRPCPVWTPEVIAAAQEAGVGGVHRYVRSFAQTPILVDGSKLTRWLGHYLHEAKPETPTKVIISVRNPYAYVTSAKMYYQASPMASALLWHQEYREALCTCAALNLDYLIVRHEDFMLRREAVMRRICGFLGIEPLAAMWAATYGPSCAIGGNPGVAALGNPEGGAKIAVPLHDIHWKRQGHGTLDARWKSELSRQEIETLAYAPGLADTAALLGYNLVMLQHDYFQAQKGA